MPYFTEIAKKRFVDGRTDGHLRLTLLGRLRKVDIKIEKNKEVAYKTVVVLILRVGYEAQPRMKSDLRAN